jgi:hypothetical protein
MTKMELNSDTRNGTVRARSLLSRRDEDGPRPFIEVEGGRRDRDHLRVSTGRRASDSVTIENTAAVRTLIERANARIAQLESTTMDIERANWSDGMRLLRERVVDPIRSERDEAREVLARAQASFGALEALVRPIVEARTDEAARSELRAHQGELADAMRRLHELLGVATVSGANGHTA